MAKITTELFPIYDSKMMKFIRSSNLFHENPEKRELWKLRFLAPNQGLDRVEQKRTFNLSLNLVKTPSGDFKQVFEDYKGYSLLDGVLTFFCNF